MKFLIVGLGSMGKRRIRNLRRLNAGEIAGFDLTAERRDDAAKTYGIKVFDDLSDALSRFAPDALVVSTPPDLHLGFAIRALKEGKHVFCEAGTTTEGIPEVLALAERGRLVAAPSCTMRFQHSIKKMKSLLTAGTIGKILAYTHHSGQYLPDWHPFEDYRAFYASRRETGACREIVAFELTWLNWLMDAEVRTVTALVGKVSTLDCDIDDVYQMALRYSNGALCHLMIDAISRVATRSLRILGETGTLEWNAGARLLRHYDAATQVWTDYPEPVPVIEPGYSGMSAEGMYDEEMDAFVRACRGEASYPHSFAEDLQILTTLVDGEKESARLISNKA